MMNVANRITSDQAALHDAYASDYDSQLRAYDCYLAEALFGLCYEFVRPGEVLLDLGIGSGVSAALFAKAEVIVDGLDFSPAMLELCRAKGFARDLKQHDLLVVPWPYPARACDHAVCCGVFHFIPDLEKIFSEARRVLRAGGMLAFTTKSPATAEKPPQQYESLATDGLEVYSHSPIYIEMLLHQNRFERMKVLRCFVGQESFDAWITRKK